MTAQRMEDTPDDPPVYDAQTFYRDVIHVAPDEHVSWIGKTGGGKTSGMIQAMASMSALYPDITYVLMVGKPHRGPEYKGRGATGDETVKRLVRTHGGRIIRDWPPPPRLPWQPRPSLYALWPRSGTDPRVDAPQHAAVFERFLLHVYSKGGCAAGADELVYIDSELGLKDLTDHQYRMGRGMEGCMWGGTQMPTYINRKAISMASHLVLWPDNDRETRRRYAEISSLDMEHVMWQLQRVRRYGKYGALYVHTDAPDGPEWAVIR